jgi:hypothetical protein
MLAAALTVIDKKSTKRKIVNNFFIDTNLLKKLI